MKNTFPSLFENHDLPVNTLRENKPLYRDTEKSQKVHLFEQQLASMLVTYNLECTFLVCSDFENFAFMAKNLRPYWIFGSFVDH